MPINPEDFRRAMRSWATGVTVVSTDYQGVRHGMTVNSFTSLSLHPPLVLISLEKGTRTHKLLLHSGTFGVTILSREQQELSDRFAGRHTDEQDRFEGLVTFTLQTGAPFLSGGLAYFDCRVIHRHEAATHHVFFGEVIQVMFGEVVEPLLYFDRAYRGLDHGDRYSNP